MGESKRTSHHAQLSKTTRSIGRPEALLVAVERLVGDLALEQAEGTRLPSPLHGDPDGDALPDSLAADDIGWEEHGNAAADALRNDGHLNQRYPDDDKDPRLVKHYC